MDPTSSPARATPPAPDLLVAAERLVDAGRPSAALALLQEATSSADVWTLAAQAALALGDRSSADLFSRKALGAAWADPRRRARLVELRATLHAPASQPRTGSSTLDALLAGLPLDTPGEVDDADLGAVVDRLLADRDADGFRRLRSRRARDLVPGVLARLDARLADRGAGWVDDDEPDHVFVGGAGRSGTTLLRAMLGAHPDLWCPPELKLVPLLAEFHARQGALAAELREAGVSGEDLDRAGRAWLRVFLEAGAPPGKRVVEKTPHDLLHTAWLGRLFPRALFVHVVRDGRAVASSLVRQRWVDPASGEPVEWCRDLASAARYWASVVTSVRVQAATVPGRYLEVRYEDLVTEPRRTMEALLAFLGERWSDEVLRHERSGVALSPLESSTAAVSRPIEAGAAAAWRGRLSAEERAEVHRAAGPALEAFGYGGEA